MLLALPPSLGREERGGRGRGGQGGGGDGPWIAGRPSQAELDSQGPEAAQAPVLRGLRTELAPCGPAASLQTQGSPLPPPPAPAQAPRPPTPPRAGPLPPPPPRAGPLLAGDTGGAHLRPRPAGRLHVPGLARRPAASRLSDLHFLKGPCCFSGKNASRICAWFFKKSNNGRTEGTARLHQAGPCSPRRCSSGATAGPGAAAGSRPHPRPVLAWRPGFLRSCEPRPRPSVPSAFLELQRLGFRLGQARMPSFFF